MKKLLLFSLFALLASAMGWAATETWTKVISTPDSWDGDYLIVYENAKDGNKAFNGAAKSIGAKNQKNVAVTISGNSITTNACNFFFTIKETTTSGQYTITSNSGLCIGTKQTSSSKTNDITTGDFTHTLSIDNSGNAIITCTGGRVLRYNTGSPRFCYYKPDNNMAAIALYKKSEAPATKVASLEYSPAFGDIAKGTVVTISCATEGAVLNGTVGTVDLNGETLPYTFTASELGELKVAVKASKEGLEDSEPLSGTYNVCQPKVAALEIKPGFGTIEVGTEITISCATEGAVLNGMIGDTDVTNAPLPYTFTAEKEGEISVLLSATKDGYDESEVLDNKFIVKAAVPVAYSDVITEAVIEKKNSYLSIDYNPADPIGALYNVYALATNKYLQFNDNKATDKKTPHYTGIVMKTSQAAASKLIITWDNSNGTGKSFEVYGKNTPYTSTKDLYGDNPGNLIETVAYSSDVPTTIDLGGKYTYIAVKPKGGVSYVTSFEFIWNEGAAGGADVTYTKASEAKAGNFAVLATADGKAVGRNADLNPAGVTVSGDAIGLNKSQLDVDEFEIIEKDAANKIYNLKGGLESDNSRCFLTYDGTGVTTVATADANADVTFEPFAAGLLVKFNDGQYLMFNGTKFIKADYGEAVVQAAGEILTPVIVFMSSSNVSTGVETVEFDENAEAQYFNLNGVQVKAENLTPGLYIVRQGNKVSKQVIR